MVSRVQVLLLDDVDGGEAAETITFALDGTQYEIDLSDTNATQLREAFARFTPHARRTAGRARPAQPRRQQQQPAARENGSREEPVPTKVIRAWAAENGIQVSDRGRIPAEVVARYQAARS